MIRFSSSHIVVLGFLSLAISGASSQAAGLRSAASDFYFQTQPGIVRSARIIPYSTHRFRVSRGPARVDSRIDGRLFKAATIAEDRAHARTKLRCWKYVKQALLEAGAVNSYPRTNYACQAGNELVSNYGFTKLPVHDPYQAPLGSVLVYGRGAGGIGHVEIRTRNGFASDYKSHNRCKYPLIGVYAKI